MALERISIRLEILKILVPAASRHGLTTEETVGISRTLENYVVESAPNGGDQPDPPTRDTLSLPRKDKQDDPIPAFMTPPQVDKSSKNRR